MPNNNRIRFASSIGSPVRCYAVSSTLTGSTKTIVTYPSISEADLKARTKAGSATAQTVDVIARLHRLPGITHLVIRSTELFVMLESASGWPSIHDEIIKILQEVYFANQLVDIEDRCQKVCTCQ